MLGRLRLRGAEGWRRVALAVLAAGVVVLGADVGDGDGLAEITLELPKINWRGTPYDGPMLPNWDEEALVLHHRGTPQVLVAPKGTENVAVGAEVTSSAKALVGTLEAIVDGDKTQEEEALVELEGGAQWVQVDLGEVHGIYGVAFWRYYHDNQAYFSTVVQISSDPEFSDDVRTVYNADLTNELGFGAGEDKVYFESYRGRLVALPAGVKGRYVRLYSNGNSWNDKNHYIEVEVYGVKSGALDEGAGDE